MLVLDEYQTVDFLLKNRGGISRYGDGELKLCFGHSAISQHADSMLQARLRKILRAAALPNHIVGIPRYDGNISMPERKRGFWSTYQSRRYLELYDPEKQYGSAFITRPDAVPEIEDPSYYGMIKKLWAGKRVLLYQGNGRRFEKGDGLFNGASDFHILYGPARDAFSKYEKILSILLREAKSVDVIVLSFGPTATLLAYDLCANGIQALDLGHLGMFYAKIHPKSKGYDGTPYPSEKRKFQ